MPTGCGDEASNFILTGSTPVQGAMKKKEQGVRRLYRHIGPLYKDSSSPFANSQMEEVFDEMDADLISSSLRWDNRANQPVGNWHYPVIDFDFECFVVESVNKEHGHLYINKLISWDNYEKLLHTLLEVGLIQFAWYENAIEDRQTFVRTEERIRHDRVHGKFSECYPGCLDESGEPKEAVEQVVF